MLCFTRFVSGVAQRAAAEALVLDQHPGGRAHAVDGALVSEENRVRLLAAWMRKVMESWRGRADFLDIPRILFE